MTRFLRRWGALGGASLAGAAVALLGVGLLQLARHDTAIRSDEHQDGRLVAVETWQNRHDELTKPILGRFERLDRKFDALLIWLRIVAQRQGWPAPPEPAYFNGPSLQQGGSYAADLAPPAKGESSR